MGLLRFCVVFLLGVGMALGAYATGSLDYVARQHFFRSWYQSGSENGLVLRVSGNALNEHCTARYAVDNRTGRHVFVVFAPDSGPLDAHLASYDDRRDAQPVSYGNEGPVDDQVDDQYDSGTYGSSADTGEDFRPADGPSRSDDRNVDPHDPRGDAADVARNDAPPPIEVGPGEEKVLGRAGEVADADGAYGARADSCGDRVVKLQITDCAASNGACVAMNNAGGPNP